MTVRSLPGTFTEAALAAMLCVLVAAAGAVPYSADSSAISSSVERARQ